MVTDTISASYKPGLPIPDKATSTFLCRDVMTCLGSQAWSPVPLRGSLDCNATMPRPKLNLETNPPQKLSPSSEAQPSPAGPQGAAFADAFKASFVRNSIQTQSLPKSEYSMCHFLAE